METAVLSRAGLWKEKGFKLGAVTLIAATYVDNIFSVASCSQDAVHILDDLAAELRSRWRLDIKPSSREVMVARSAPVQVCSQDAWKSIWTLECLGHLISDDCSVTADWQRTRQNMLASFWVNVAHRSLTSAPLSLKLRQLDRCVRPLLDFRCTRWPPVADQLRQEDALQRKMLCILQRVQPKQDETFEAFCQRRRALSTRLASKRGRWSDRHIKRCAEWREHLQREHNLDSWPAQLLQFNDAQWLGIVRAVRKCAARQGTGTRTSAGAPQARWEEALRSTKRR